MVSSINQGNIQTAVNLWVSNPVTGEATYGHISIWDTSSVTNMSNLFKDTSFNDDISGWNTSNVTNMSFMFRNSIRFNQDIGKWNTSKVVSIQNMFHRASDFNNGGESLDTRTLVDSNDISYTAWDVSGTTNFYSLFSEALVFNQPIGNWNTSSVTDMSWMFYKDASFNQDIGNWNTSSVTAMNNMFMEASSFNQDIGNWNTSKVTVIQNMFQNASEFNNGGASLDTKQVTKDGVSYTAWDTSKVTTMQDMFKRAYDFDQPIGNWNTSEVTNMIYMFNNATAFNQDIGGWDTSSMTTINGFLQTFSSSFQQDLSTWLRPEGITAGNVGSATNNALGVYTPPSSAPICFPKGTPVLTNLGPIAIEKLKPEKHTIRGKKIIAITKSIPLQKHIVCFEKDSLTKDVPSQRTLCSMEHKVFCKGKMMKARDIVNVCEHVTFIPYNGQPLYNVVLKKQDKMMINNLICETLHPENIMAKINAIQNEKHKNKVIRQLTRIIKENNFPEYKKLYASLPRV